MGVNLGDPDYENPKRKRKRRKLLVHEKVEVRSVEDGFQGSWHSGTIIACENLARHVKYDHLLRDDGSENLVAVVGVSPTIDGIIVASNGTQRNYRGCIRPLPPRLDFGKWCLHYGLCVDALFQEAWWEGVIFDHDDGSKERRIFFPDMGDEMKIGIDKLRITQDWDEVAENWERRGNWLFLELIDEYEQERPLIVSVKQIWCDLREKNSFRKVRDWTCSKIALWKELVLEAINNNLALSVNEISGVLELPEPALDVALEPEANLAIFPVDNNCLLDSDMMIDNDTNEMTLLDCSIKVFDKWVENGGLETGLLHTNFNSTSIQPIQEILDLDELIYVMEDDGLSSYQASKLYGKPTCSTRRGNPNWLPAGPDILPGAEFCPGAITDYALASMANRKPRNSLTKNVRKHLSYLRWKIEFMKDKGTLRMRYTSPEGKCYDSLRKVCHDLRELAETLSPISQDDRRSLPTSPDNLSSSEVPPASDVVVVEPEYCPQAVVDWYNMIGDKKDTSSKAKKHLSAMGWVFWYANEKGKRELRYKSPGGKCYYSLRTACKSCMDEGGVYKSLGS